MKRCRWNIGRSCEDWINCGEPTVVTRKGGHYCAAHDPVARAMRSTLQKSAAAEALLADSRGRSWVKFAMAQGYFSRDRDRFFDVVIYIRRDGSIADRRAFPG